VADCLAVGFLINSLHCGGAEKVFATDSAYLSGLGITVYCITLDESSHPLNEIIAYNLHSSRETSLQTAIKLSHYIRVKGITHLYVTLDRSIKIALFAKLLNRNFRLIVREARIYHYKPRYLRWTDKILSNLVDQYVAVSSAVKDSMPQNFLQRSSKVTVLTNGVKERAQRDNYHSEVVNLVTVANLWPIKRIDLVIQAFGRLSDAFPELNLLIIGLGLAESSLKRLARAQPGANRVKFLGQLTRQQIDLIYQSPSVFVLASDDEGCPNALLEAMAHGLPCVGSDAKGVAEVLDHGRAGAMFERGSVDSLVSALLRVLHSSHYRRQLGNTGFLHSKTCYSMQQHFAELERVLFPEGLPASVRCSALVQDIEGKV
jgi:glycosyltransferase involved in cell wall biosynthesis